MCFFLFVLYLFACLFLGKAKHCYNFVISGRLIFGGKIQACHDKPGASEDDGPIERNEQVDQANKYLLGIREREEFETLSGIGTR